MSEKCFLFEGQGAQVMGMGKEIYDDFNSARDIFKIGSEITGNSLGKLCFESQSDELNQTKNSQLAIFTVSMAIFNILKDKNIIPKYYAGFSLGECSALCAMGVFSLEDGFKIVKKRGELMQQCAENTSGAMYAIIGLQDEEVEKACKQCGGYVIAANYNCPNQLVIAGDEEAAQKAADICKEKGAIKAVRLPVNGAFHSKHMEYASQQFKQFLEGFSFSSPNGIFYSNVSGKEMNDFSNIPEYLSKHIISPVLWKNEIININNQGNIDFYEIGCGKTLTGFNRKIDRAIPTANLSSGKNILNEFGV